MRIKPTVQHYDAYSAEDFKVWALLFNRQMKLLQSKASALYLKAIGDIGFNAKEIPNFEQINHKLLSTTGWQLTVAPELVPLERFFELLSRKIFPATCWLRSLNELDYLEEPDMFHDVFGHAPLLIHKEYAAFMEAFGRLAMNWRHHPEALRLLSRIYWFTIEFGLISEAGQIKIYGAGIISSPSETYHALNRNTEKSNFDIHRMIQTNYHTDTVQNIYFTANALSQLYNSLSEIEIQLEMLMVKEDEEIKNSR